MLVTALDGIYSQYGIYITWYIMSYYFFFSIDWPVNCRDDGDGARWNMLTKEGITRWFHKLRKNLFISNSIYFGRLWWWHSLPKYIDFFINKFFLILWNHLVIPTIHTDLQIPTITEIIKSRLIKFHSNLSIHPNPLFQDLSPPYHPLHPPRLLNRQWPRDFHVYVIPIVLVTHKAVDCTK
jgi:hypothetical protein